MARVLLRDTWWKLLTWLGPRILSWILFGEAIGINANEGSCSFRCKGAVYQTLVFVEFF